jgi:hypothetical protein
LDNQPKTLRDIDGMGDGRAALRDAALVLIGPNTYRSGTLQLECVEPALAEARRVHRRRGVQQCAEHRRMDAARKHAYVAREGMVSLRPTSS